MRHRLDADLLFDEHAREQRTHATLRARPVGDVDGIDSRRFEATDVREHTRRIHAARRHDLHRRHELTRRDFRSPLGALGERHRANALRREREAGRRKRGSGRGPGPVTPAVTARLPSPATRQPRIQRPNSLHDRMDVFRRRTAAAADDLGARLHQMMRVRSHVLRTGHVHATPADIARHAGVRLRAQLFARVRDHLLDALENRLRSDRAIEADHVRTPPVERARHVLGRGTIGRPAIDTDRHLRHDGEGRRDGSRGPDRLLDLQQIAECFDDEEIDPPLGQPLHLLAENRERFLRAGRAVRFDAHAEWPNGACDECTVIGRFACDGRRGAIDLSHLCLEPVLRELQPIRAEAVRLEHLRPRLHVRLVDVAHELRCSQAQLIVALVDEHALSIEHRAHRAVEEHDPARVEQILEQRRAR